MNTMNFNHTFSKVSLLTIIFLNGLSGARATVVPEVEDALDPIPWSGNSLKIAQNEETVPTASLEIEIIAQINRARENPNAYGDWLEAQKQYYDGIMLKLPGERPVRTNKGLQALEEAIDFVRQQSPLTPLSYSEAMAIAAQEQLTPITENRRDSRSRNLSYGKVTAEGIVFQLVVDDGFPDRRRRLAIFSDQNQEVGVSCQEDIVYEQKCAIAYGVNAEDLSLSEDVSVTESSPVSSVTEGTAETIAEPETAIAPDPDDITTPEEISIPEATSVEENVIEPEANSTESGLNNQPHNSLSIDKVERGFLGEGDKVIPNDGSFYDSYPIAIKAGESFVISLESTDFDTFLAIMDEEGNIIEQNDDISEDDSNSQLEVTIARDGNYSLIVNAYDQGGKGAYILTISR